jgi:DNA-binding GntR family transcriptional regulator
MSGPATTQQHAVDALRRAIVARELRPGQRVPQEDFAASLEISVAPVREALRTLEQEGQVTYIPRRGYFVTELRVADLREIYALRRLLEERAARHALPLLGADEIARIEAAAADCVDAASDGRIADELEANRRFHLAILDGSDQPHLIRIIEQLWRSTEAYRAMYYNLPAEREESISAHDRILGAIRDRDAGRLIAELDAHRDRALAVLGDILDE